MKTLAAVIAALVVSVSGCATNGGNHQAAQPQSPYSSAWQP